ncbi:MAG TPA: CNNM domain-containing protein [Anaerohalosphaeraceae bacterium]|nr:CNNM domain-containing protein [Anaerohalosphaeraceae bacterium]
MTFFTALTVLVILVGLSGIMAGAETGTYRLSRFRLRLGCEQKRPFHLLLSHVVQDSHGLILSLLMANNLANYFATSLAAYLFYTRLKNPGLAELYSSAVMTPLLFIFVDILPKNLFYYRADSFLLTLSPLIWFVYNLFTRTGLTSLLKWFSGRLNRFFHTSIDMPLAVDLTQREQIQQIFHETREEGLLSDIQKSMMDRLLRTPSLPVTSVMTPWRQVRMLDLHTPSEQIIAQLIQSPFVRLPVYDKTTQKIRGWVEVYDVIACSAGFTTLEPFLKPIMTVSAGCSVLSALHQMRRQKQTLALVVSETSSAHSQEILGLVTCRDLIEEFTGELP